MTETHLKKLIGRTLTDGIAIHDYVQLSFGSHVGLSIYNKISLIPNAALISDFIVKKVTSISISKNAVVMLFDASHEIVVDMSQNGFRGPEALQLNYLDENPVIWN